MGLTTLMRMAVFALAVGTAGSAQASEAEDLMRAGRVAEALPVARAEAEAAPGNLEANERYIDALLSMGLLGIADSTYRARVEAIPSADSWYLFARVLVDADEAERAYKLALSQDPEHARSFMGLGAVYRATAKVQPAEEAYKSALALDATLAEAYSGLVQLQVGTGRLEEAVATARTAIAALPNDPDAYLMLAQLEPQTRLDTLRIGARKAPSDPRLHASLAEAWLDSGHGAEARTAASAALALSPSFADPALSLLFADEMARDVLDADGYHALLATRLIEETDSFGALAEYTRLIAEYPDSALPYMSRARVHARKNNNTAAISDLANAIGNDPQNIDAQAALGLLLLQADRLTEATSVLHRVVRARPGDATLALALSRSQEASGQLVLARATVDAVRELRPLHVEAALHGAKLAAITGDSEAAYQILITVAREVPDERLVLALAAASKDVGRTTDAALWLDSLATSSGNPAYGELAAQLRSGR